MFLFSQNFISQIVQDLRPGHYQSAGLVAKNQQGVSRRDAVKSAGLLRNYDLPPVAHLGGAEDPVFTKPAIVLADEPTGNLDSKTSAEVLGLIKRTSAEFRQTVVMITHNDDIARLADRIVRIEDGKIVE